MGIQMRCHFVPILIRSEAFWLQRGGVHFAIVLPNGNTLRPTREAGLVQIANARFDQDLIDKPRVGICRPPKKTRGQIGSTSRFFDPN